MVKQCSFLPLQFTAVAYDVGDTLALISEFVFFFHRVSNIFQMLVIIAIHSGRTSAAGILNLVLMNSRSVQSVRHFTTFCSLCTE